MKSRGRWRTVALVAAALFVGSVVGPPLVQAATNLVTIAGPGGKQAKVSAAGQLLTTETTPSTFVHDAALGLTASSGPCVPVATAPADKGLIVTQVVADVFTNPTPGGGQRIDVFSDSACSNLILDVNPGGIGAYGYPLQPGVAIPAGSSLSANVAGAVQTEIYTYGYTVPSSEVPATSPASGASAKDQRQTG